MRDSFPATLGIAALALGSVLIGCSSRSEEEGPAPPDAQPARAQIVTLQPEAAARAALETAPVSRGLFRTHRDFPATVQPNKNRLAEVTTLVRGRAVDVYVDVGQDVKEGALLARFYSSELGLAQASYLKAGARLHEAQLVFERARGMLEDRAISVAEFQKREMELKTVRAEAREAHDRLKALGMDEPSIERLDRDHVISAYVPIRAPFAGRVIARNLAKGEVVETAQELFTIADLSEVWVLANIPEKDVRLVHRDQEVEVRITAYPHETFHGPITYVGDVLDPATRTMKLRVTLPNPDGRLKPEMFATVRIYTATDPDALTIPLSAVQPVPAQALPLVFVQLDPLRYEGRPVKLGEESGEVVKVLDGLHEDERVVTKGGFLLKSELLKQQIEETR